MKTRGPHTGNQLTGLGGNIFLLSCSGQDLRTIFAIIAPQRVPPLISRRPYLLGPYSLDSLQAENSGWIRIAYLSRWPALLVPQDVYMLPELVHVRTELAQSPRRSCHSLTDLFILIVITYLILILTRKRAILLRVKLKLNK